MEAGPRKWKPSKESVGLVAIVLIAVILVAWVLTPSISPLSGIHDTDGDGHPDLKDAAPNDPTKWAWGVATIIVTIYSSHDLNDTHYKLYLNNYLKNEGDLAPGAHAMKFISAKILIGATNSTQVVLTATSTGGESGDEIDQETLVVRDGQAYAVSLTV